MGREGNRKVEKERRRETERGGNTVSGWRTVSGYSHSWPRIFLFKYVFSTRLGMCSRRRWSTLFVAFLRSLLASRKCCVHHSTKKQYAERPTSEPPPTPLNPLPTNFIEPLARTPARHNFNWCRHEKQLLHKLTRHQHFVYSCYLFPIPCTPATSFCIPFLQHHHVHPVLFFAN